MAKLRKMLGKADSPYIISLMRVIETQSKETIAKWCIDYAEKEMLPICMKYYPDAVCCEAALKGARLYLDGGITLSDAKKLISDVQRFSRELEETPAAQAAVRAIGQSAATIHTSTNSLALAFYGSAAIAYERFGLEQTDMFYDSVAAEECGKMLTDLSAISIENEPNPAKIKWGC